MVTYSDLFTFVIMLCAVITPVSYTHLDVYKRQFQINTVFFMKNYNYLLFQAPDFQPED